MALTRKVIFVLGIILLFCSGAFFPTQAEEGAFYVNPTTSKDITPNGDDDKSLIHAQYVKPTYQSINQLLWLLGVYDVSNEQDVENYIRTSECNLFKKYFQDDFEWKKIRVATADYLTKYSPGFSNYFDVLQSIRLGRYDFDMKGFPLENAQELNKISVLQIYGGGTESHNEEGCEGISASGDGRYTSTAAVKLKSPVTVTYVRVGEDLAKEYLKYVEERHEGSDGKLAYIRYKVRVDRFLGRTAYQGLGWVQVFSGKVLQIDIFADQEMFLPLFSQVYE